MGFSGVFKRDRVALSITTEINGTHFRGSTLTVVGVRIRGNIVSDCHEA